MRPMSKIMATYRRDGMVNSSMNDPTRLRTNFVDTVEMCILGDCHEGNRKNPN